MCLTSDWFWVLILQLAIFFVLGRVRTRPLWGLPQGVAVGIIDHFTVACSVTWPLNGSKATGDLALIETSLVFSCKYT